MRFRGSMPAVVLAAGLALAGAVLAAPRTQTETKLQLVVSTLRRRSQRVIRRWSAIPLDAYFESYLGLPGCDA